MIYVVTYITESGDRGVLAAYKEQPTDAHISTEVIEKRPWEVEDGVSYLHWEVHEIPITDLPEPSEVLDRV